MSSKNRLEKSLHNNPKLIKTLIKTLSSQIGERISHQGSNLIVIIQIVVVTTIICRFLQGGCASG
jgi:hypothetical protein